MGPLGPIGPIGPPGPMELGDDTGSPSGPRIGPFLFIPGIIPPSIPGIMPPGPIPSGPPGGFELLVSCWLI